MKPKTRLHMSLVIVAISAIFGFLAIFEKSIADDVALWYVPTILTMILLSNLWKRDV